MKNKIVVLTIGNEILLGKTVNTNSALIGQQLSLAGYEVVANLVCADTKESITKTLEYAYSLAEVVVCTGGLGPTADDITRGVVATFFGSELQWNDELWQKIKRFYEDRTGQEVCPNNKAQAMVPQRFSYLVNRVGTAPALYRSIGKQKIFLLPGVPAEMEFFMQELVMPQLAKIYPPRQFFLQTLHLAGMPEALIAQKSAGVNIADGVSLAYLPQGGFVDLRVYGQNVSGCRALLAELEELFAQQIVGRGDGDLVQELHKRLLQKKVSLAIAESCTGGMLTSKLVDFAGSSHYLLGGVVSYANSIKQKILGVDGKLLEQYGAVSSQVAQAMAKGVADKFGSDLAVAITGIAGPDGGSKQKPVGLVWFAVYHQGRMHCFSKNFSGERNSIREKAVNVVVGFLLAQEYLTT